MLYDNIILCKLKLSESTCSNALAIICDETPTKFRELVSSFLENDSGKAAASDVIHKSNKKPVYVNEIKSRAFNDFAEE